MNTDTGCIYEVREEVLRGPHGRDVPDGTSELRHFREVAARLEALTSDEQAMLNDLADGATIVPVSEQVAQKVRLGERELKRRAKRREATRAARQRQRV